MMKGIANRSGKTPRRSFWAATALAGLATLSASSLGAAAEPAQPAPAVKVPDLSSMCQVASLQAVAASLSGAGVTVQQIANGPFKNGARLVPAKGAVPAFCQVTGSFVTNPATGKTANFLATFPESWNGKYLQLGCSGHCGQFYVSDPATPSVTVTAQGYPGQLIEKGYAIFATDEGHSGMGSADWAVRKDGSVDADYVDDFLYRADKVLAKTGKALTTAFYAKASGTQGKIKRSYFNGCSGGGRDAMVVASYFPEEFDGIIGGSPYDVMGVSFQGSAIAQASKRSPDAALNPGLLALLDTVVKKQCDGLDGVKDGIIQNPAACNFRPEHDLPVCTGNAPAGECFTKAQVETISTILSAVTDDRGDIVQPGYSVSELQVLGSGLSELSDPVHKVFVHKNDPNFSVAANIAFKSGDVGPITNFHAVIPATEVAASRAALGLGVGTFLENSDRLMKGRTKLLMWHNFSDERLTPYMSINYYKKLARKYGGYAAVQKQARLFLLPGTAHCSITGIGPNSFDSMGALENWVEKGQAPDALKVSVAARQFMPGAPAAPALKFPNWTMPLCKFPEMATYSGKGDIKDSANWSCSAKDSRLLQVGESGRQAGVVE
ncbi:MAG TPA: tannase/feruloyl esterase family alpha/beta hydrolase [Sphingobium sp.]|uniref:tannase/feruloyl esterase family alpha/beta hydrolase n=1 Tax=Sphingobium sp. TaxID=1912891 RepID=UPI002ED3821B